jgi:hypothetical protein
MKTGITIFAIVVLILCVMLAIIKSKNDTKFVKSSTSYISISSMPNNSISSYRFSVDY